MGNDISAGHTYSSTSPNNAVTASNLNEHVNGATLKPTAISARTAKSPVLGAEELLINDGGVLKKATVNTLSNYIFPDGSIDKTKLTPDVVHGQTEKASPTDDDEILIYDDASATLKKASFGSLAAQPLGGARGVIIKSASDSTLTISVSAIVLLNAIGGGARHIGPSTQTVNIGNEGANGLDSDGGAAANTWYYIWGISDGTNFRGLLSTSATAPTMPSGFAYKLLLGTVRTDSSSDFVPFSQLGNQVYTGRVQVLENTGPINVNTLQSLSIGDAVPPIAIACTGQGYTEDADPNDWGMAIAGNAAGVGLALFALDALGTATVWFGGRRTYSYDNIPILTPQVIYWTAKRTGDVSNIDITGYTLNLH